MPSDQPLNEPLKWDSETPTVNLEEANIGQLTPGQKSQLMSLLEEYTDVFAVNPKAVEACGSPPMVLELKDPNSKPDVTPTRNYTPSSGR